MRYLLDTDTLSDLMRRRPSAALLAHIQAVPSDEQVTSSIVIAEMFRGAYRHPSRSEQLLDQIRNIVLTNFEVLRFDEQVADNYGRITAYLESRGTPIGIGDTMIAATALAHDLVMVAGNVRHHSRVPGLQVENWIR